MYFERNTILHSGLKLEQEKCVDFSLYTFCVFRFLAYYDLFYKLHHGAKLKQFCYYSPLCLKLGFTIVFYFNKNFSFLDLFSYTTNVLRFLSDICCHCFIHTVKKTSILISTFQFLYNKIWLQSEFSFYFTFLSMD